jgi:hypothetical protein
MLSVTSAYCYAECHYAECHYAECRGTVVIVILISRFLLILNVNKTLTLKISKNLFLCLSRR